MATVTAIAAGMLGGLPVAAHASGNSVPYIHQVDKAHDANNAVALEVDVVSSDPVASVSATISQNGSVVATVPAEAFHQTDGGRNWLGVDDPYTTWIASVPAGVAPGNYQVSYEAVDAGGDTGSGSGFLPYVDNSYISVQTAPSDWAHPLVIKGKYLRLHPDGTLIAPIPGKVTAKQQSLDPTDPEAAVGQGTAGADGSFSITPADYAAYSNYYLYVHGVPDDTSEQAADSGYSQPALVKSETRIRLDKSSFTTQYGKPLPVSGVAEYFDQTLQAWKPLVGVYVHNSGLSLPAVTNSSGRFTITYSKVLGDISDGIEIGNAPGRSDPWTVPQYLKTSRAFLTVNEIDATTLRLTSASIGADSVLKLAGRITAVSNVRIPSVAIQQSPDGKTGWKNIGAATTTANGSFSWKRLLTTPRGYWRVRYNGFVDSNHVYPGPPDHTAATSPVKHLVRTVTRFTGYKVSPARVAAGRPITVSGTLQRQPGTTTFKAFAGQKVRIYFRLLNSKAFTYKGTVTTDSHGHFSKAYKGQWTGYWRAVWRTPDSHSLDAVSSQNRVNVTH